MAERIGATPVRYPFSFVIAGDSGAWADPTADAIYRQLLGQVARLTPAPLFLANLGDFAGPGTPERHRHYLELVRDLPVPDLCVVGNHDLDDPGALEAWAQVHGPTNFSFAYGHTRFVAINSGRAVQTPAGTEGPDEDALAFLAHTLEAAPEPHRVVLMHIPPAPGWALHAPPRVGLQRRRTGVPRARPPPSRRAGVLRARAGVRPRRAPGDAVRRLGGRWHRPVLASARRLRRGPGPPRGPGRLVPRRRAHRHRARRRLRPRPPGLRPGRRARPHRLRRPFRDHERVGDREAHARWRERLATLLPDPDQ
jgi:3',5'-cyclic AMP phosphodiesterase CpdA